MTTIHKYRDPQVKELLGIPAEVETAALIPVPVTNLIRGAEPNAPDHSSVNV
jgi:hypothetical protein